MSLRVHPARAALAATRTEGILEFTLPRVLGPFTRPRRPSAARHPATFLTLVASFTHLLVPGLR